jgi:hypothetical protein
VNVIDSLAPAWVDPVRVALYAAVLDALDHEPDLVRYELRSS